MAGWPPLTPSPSWPVAPTKGTEPWKDAPGQPDPDGGPVKK